MQDTGLNSNSLPLVSVVISTYNRPRYLRTAIESVLAQTLTNFELIVCDDASTDETPAVCREMQSQDTRIRILRHPQNLGMVGNWKAGLDACIGRYFCKLDDDNLYLPTFLAASVDALEAVAEASFAFCDEWRIDDLGHRDVTETEQDSLRYHRTGLARGLCSDTPLLAVRQTPGINSALFRREDFLRVGGFRQLAGNLADFDAFLNLAGCGYQAYYLPERLTEYRKHSAQDGGTYLTNSANAQAAIRILESSHFDGMAEKARLEKLAQAYITLSRVLLLNQDFIGARQAIREASALRPKHLRTTLLSSLFQIPNSILLKGLRLRYGKELKQMRK